MARRSDAPGKKPAKKSPKRGSVTAARRAHNPEVPGSTPGPATKATKAKKAPPAPAKRAKPKTATPPAKKKPTAHKAVKGTAQRLLAAKAVADPDNRDEDGLAPALREFVQHYTVHRNATEAYAVSHPGVTRKTAATEGWRLLRNPEIRRVLDRIWNETLRTYQTDREELIGKLVAIVLADPRELSEIRIGACKGCFDGDVATPFEGYWNADPDMKCRFCAGEGEPRDVFHDSRNLSPRALALFKGVKRTKDGIQVLQHDPLEAMEKLNRIMGLYEKDNEQKQTPLGEALQALMSGIHEVGSRMPIAPPKDETP